MVNNATNINKTQNHISSQPIEHKKTTTYDVGNSGPGLGQAQKCGVVEQLNGTPIPFLITGSPTAIHIHVYIIKRYKNLHRFASTQ
jgi:hypothetical protein